MNSPKLHGILPVIPTPFDEDGKVDTAAIERVTQFCVDAGAHGLVFPGVASEFDHLSPEEQKSLLEAVCRVADNRLPIICGGGNGGPENIGNFINQAHDLGVVAAMVLIPNRFAGDTEGALSYIQSIIERATDVDIILQNAPAPVGAGLEAEELSKIIAACPAIRYVKEEALPSGPRISAIKAAAPEHLVGVIGGGGARYLISEMSRGALGAMPAAEITDLHVRMWNAYQNGDKAAARDLYTITLPLLIIQFLYRMRLTKHVLTRRGILNNSIVRAPLPEFDAFDDVELSEQLESLSNLFEIAPLKSVEV